jgi:ribose transport system substrate-binding protein
MLRKLKILCVVLVAVFVAFSSLAALAAPGDWKCPVTSDGKVDWDALGIPPVKIDNTKTFDIASMAPNGKMFNSQQDVFNLFTPEDIEKIYNGGYTTTVAMHFMNSWGQLQKSGIEKACAAMNIKILTLTDARGQADQQIADIESGMGLKPNMILVKSVDDDALVEVETKAADSGIVVVGIDTANTDLIESGKVVGMCQADNYTFSRLCVEAIAKAINEEGEVVMLNYVNPLWHTNLRTQAALDTFAKYPKIKIVDQQKMGGEEEAATITESLISAYPNIKGVWAAWDNPAVAAASVASNLGKSVVVSGPGLSTDSGYVLASGGAFVGGSSDFPYDAGITETLMGIAKVIGKDVPRYVALPVVKLDRDSLKETWTQVFHEPIPEEFIEALEEKK